MKVTSAIVVLGLLAGTAHADVKVGDKFVELDAKTAKGKNFRLKDMAGKWVVFTFGASWCQPCHKELPAWDKIAPKFAGKALFVAVNINDKQQEGQDFLTSLNLKHMFPVFMPQETSEALKSYDPEHMPSTFVIDPSGVVQEIHLGFDKGDDDKLAKRLAELIK
jgi:cytochrome c biogenesis protein CcmG/thiol:disulfide interchange protein DsbE